MVRETQLTKLLTPCSFVYNVPLTRRSRYIIKYRKLRIDNRHLIVHGRLWKYCNSSSQSCAAKGGKLLVSR